MTLVAKLVRWCASGSVVIVAILASSSGAAASGSGAVPFTDPKQNGLITVCNAAGEAVSSGSLATVPFSAKALSSTAAPKGYRRHGIATLYAFQPIQGIPPGDWSGEQLNGGSYFKNAANPASVSDIADRRLLDVAQAYPPRWDGLLQLRIMYTAPNRVPYYLSYPTAVIRVSGSSWSMVQGGSTSCSASSGTPFSEIALGSKGVNQLARRNGVKVTPTASATPDAQSSGGSAPASTTPSGGPSAGDSAGSSTPAGDPQATGSGGVGSNAKAVIGLGIVAILVAGIATVIVRRRGGAERL